MLQRNKLPILYFSLALSLVWFFILSSSVKAAIDYSCGNGATAKSFSGNTGYCTSATINSKKYNIYCGVPMLAEKSINIKQNLGSEYYKTDAEGNIILMSDAVTNLIVPNVSSDSKIVIGKNQTIILSKANSNISGEIFPNYNLSTILSSGTYTSQPNRFFLIKNAANTNAAVFDADGLYAGNGKGNIYAMGIFMKDKLIVNGSGTTGSQIVKTNNDVIAISPASYNINSATINLNNYFAGANNTYPLLCRVEDYGTAKVFKLEKQCYDGTNVYSNNELSANSCQQCQPTSPENIKAGLINLAAQTSCPDGKCDGAGNCYQCLTDSDCNVGVCEKCNQLTHQCYAVAAGANNNPTTCPAGQSCNGASACKLDNNQTCTSDAACLSGDCNAKPDGSWLCSANTYGCVYDNNTGASSPSDTTCSGIDKYTCARESVYPSTNGWVKTDCAKDCDLYNNVHNCSGASCQSCPASCAYADNSECKSGAYCVAGECRSGVNTICIDDGDCDSDSGYTCDTHDPANKKCVANGSISDNSGCSKNEQCTSGACCSNICKNTPTDANNCGSCGNVCSTAGGSAYCLVGSCYINCSAGYANCDNNAGLNGCEKNLNIDTSSCGACGTVCNTPPNADCYEASGSCSSGSCSYTKKADDTSCGAGSKCYNGSCSINRCDINNVLLPCAIY